LSPSRIVESAAVEPFRPDRHGSGPVSLEAQLEEAYRRGHREGRAEGERAAAQQLDAAREELAATVARSLERIAEFERRATEALEGELLALALALAGRIVHQRIADGDPVAERVARDLLSEFHVDVGARLRVNPDDRRRMLAGDAESVPRGVELVEDAGLAPGEVLVEWRDEQIDARFDAVVSQLVAELRGER